MATNLDLDQDLVNEALRVSGETTKKAAVTRALREFVMRYQQERIADLFGTLQWDADYDYKTERHRL